jgi:LmbE family N-acetylglucosaminyl deacetylase
MVILAIGAHPDDIEFGCAGTLAKHKAAGDEVHLLILTLGEGGETPTETRKKEAEASAAILGVDSTEFGGISAFDLFVVKHDFIRVIEERIGKIKPDRIYCHTQYDRHQVHEAAARCTLIAARHVKEIFQIELPSTTQDFKPNVFVDISDTLDRKTECIDAFKSQSDKYYMRISAIRGLARYRAFQADIRNPSSDEGSAAEAFYIERMIISTKM